ncbi:zinc-finger domain of monoamine-oxidase A repressor R1 protein isoform X2 [Tasmannia lanceolata]|uniref:zinc-finger domain of monoamine-oxidase A repressor R1 protein isoform X2 n=1 Tax=Tasmannia lanceolata TaxID=3420 RepID=UPI0040628AAA
MAVSPHSGSKPIITTSPTSNKQKKKNKKNDLSSPKRNNRPGVRVKGCRIYDSENGKTCHQCRQKTMDFVAACKNANGKPCTIKFCHKCLLNRYGEKAEEMALLDDWNCPKCRGICNCSCCMKKKGHKPTGILAHTAKATGFSSVLELLHLKSSEDLGAEKAVSDLLALRNKSVASSKELAHSKRKHGNENFSAEQGVSDKKNQIMKDSPNSLNKSAVSSKGLVPSKRKRGKENPFIVKNTPTSPNKSVVTGKGLTPSKGTLEKEDSSVEQGGLNLLCKTLLVCNDLKLVSENIGKKQKKKLRLDRTDVYQGSTDDNGLNEDLKARASKNIPVDSILKAEKVNGRDLVLPAVGETKVPDVKNNNHAESMPLPIAKFCQLEKDIARRHNKDAIPCIKLPQGTALATIAGIELSADDVGPALQFLEFCSAFGKVLDLKKGQPEIVLRDLTLTRRIIGRRGLNSSIAEFHIKLLSLLQTDLRKDGNSWIQALGKCISESHYASKDFPLDCFNVGANGYDTLDTSKKLRLLNFLCDETLGTEDLRNWMDKENSKFIERKKEANEKVLAAKEKERCMKQKVKDEVAQAILSSRNGAPLSVSEHASLVSKIKSETEKAHAEKLEAMDTVSKKKQRFDAVRTDPIILNGNGQVYWRLKGCSRSHLVLQEIVNSDLITPHDKWFIYDGEQEKTVEKYISSLRKKTQRKCTIPDTPTMWSNEASEKHFFPSTSSSPKSATPERATEEI